MKFLRWFLLSLTIFTFPQLGLSPHFQARAESAQKIKVKEDEIRQSMVTISRQLGVTCTECHNMKKLTDDSLKSFQVAREHMKIVEMLKLNGMDGKKGPEASCYMCHRGQMSVPYKEKLTNH